MTSADEREVRDPGESDSMSADRPGPLPALGLAATMSIGAGAIHAAAIGIHAEHPALARAFVVCALAQLLAGLLALIRPGRLAAIALTSVNLAAVGGWVITRTTGLSWIDGLAEREAPQFADTTCAAIGLVAAVAAAVAYIASPRSNSIHRMAIPSLLALVITVPAMLAAGTHVHEHDHEAAAAGAAAGTATTEHVHEAAAAGSAAGAAAGTATTEHVHNGDPGIPIGEGVAATDTTAHTHDHTTAQAASWPRPWDPSQPVDLSGVAGVSQEQQARATTLVEDSLIDLPRWADTATAVADGYTSIGDAGTGNEHYIKLSLIQDEVILDPTQPESLVYAVDGDRRTLSGAMFIAPAQPTDSPTLVDWAGPLMQWHNHGNLCWDRNAAGAATVVGIVDSNGQCARGINTGGANPMVHVWITANPCGVFAALEGVGAGQAAVPDAQRVDMCQAAHDHGTASDGATAAVVAKPYDPALPIDLGGTPGVTPAQQAAAENLVAINVVRLPQWADYHVAEAAGFHSIGDGASGTEHFVNWNWINDDVALDPDHPESLVYRPQADGTKLLVSAMYMLPSSVALDAVPDIGGALMQWHIHDNLCFTSDPIAPQVAGLVDGQGGCRSGLTTFPPSPMIHVWIVPNACGPFAALDGIAAGQIAAGQERLCDHLHGDGLL